MGDANATPNEIMKFLQTFKSSIEDKMEKNQESMENKMGEKFVNMEKKMDVRLDTIDDDIKELRANRFVHLNRVCREERERQPSLKTQLRFGKRDLELFVKYKGDKAPYKLVKLEDFTDPLSIPAFDHTIRWKYHEDKPPRRRLNEAPEHSGTTKPPGPPTTGKDEQRTSPMIRQHSESNNDPTNKKSKLYSASSGEDMDESEPETDSPEDPTNQKNYVSIQ